MIPQFDVIVPDGLDPGAVHRALIVELVDYYEDALAARTAERDFHESQSLAYIDEIARLKYQRISTYTRVTSRIRRVLRG